METDSKPLIPKRKEMSSGKILAVDQIIVVWYFETTRLIQWRLSSHQPDQNSHSTVEHQDGKKKTEKSPDWEGSEGSIGFSQSAGQKPLRKSLINDASRPPITNPIHQEKKEKGKQHQSMEKSETEARRIANPGTRAAHRRRRL
jgi:hypothetical protein